MKGDCRVLVSLSLLSWLLRGEQSAAPSTGRGRAERQISSGLDANSVTLAKFFALLEHTFALFLCRYNLSQSLEHVPPALECALSSKTPMSSL